MASGSEGEGGQLLAVCDSTEQAELAFFSEWTDIRLFKLCTECVGLIDQTLGGGVVERNSCFLLCSCVWVSSS